MSETTPSGADPGQNAVRSYLLYTLSLPERALRSTGAVVAGALRESASLLVPSAFQDSKTYAVLVRQTLNFLAEDVGGVARQAKDAANPQVENFVARKAVGNFVEMAGLATLHMSPLLLLAVVSDVAYGSQAYLRELSAELKRDGVIAQDSTVDRVDDLLAAVAKASGVAASALDTPPLNLQALQETVAETRQAVSQIDPSKVIPQAELTRLWEEMRSVADRENVSLLDVSTAVTLSSLDKIGAAGRGALSSVRAAGRLLDRHVIDHYSRALADIRNEGFYPLLSRASEPYIEAVWHNFATDRQTITEDVLRGRWLGTGWRKLKGWFNK